MSDIPEAFFEILRFDGLAIPTLGPTGSPVVRVDVFDAKNKYETHHFLPRMPPSRDVPVWNDDDDIVDYRRMSDDEYAAALAATARWNAEYDRTNGTHVDHLDTDYAITLTCRDGCVAKARGDGFAWAWTDIETRIWPGLPPRQKQA